jgi:nicotinamide mononucleotide transporter
MMIMVDIQVKKTWQEFFIRELRNWHPVELIFMTFSLAAVVTITVMTGGDSFVGIVSAATGIMYTLLAGKGKSSCYLFGIVNSFLYGLIAMQSRIYGDMLLNWAYYLPMQFVGLWLWNRNYNTQKGEVRKQTLSTMSRILFVLLVLAVWSVFALVLERFNARSPWLDSATTVLSVTAMILSVMRRFEQWICWTLVNGISIFMWYQVYTTSGGSLATLLMWIIFFVCGLVFAWQWHKSAGQEEK